MEFIFRAYIEIDMQIVKVHTIDFNEKDIGVLSVNMMGHAFIKKWSFAEVELMQYIGLKDRNGVEIYVGDKVRVRDGYKPYREFEGIVGFRDGSFMIKDDVGSNYRWMDYEVEVIGNIYKE